MTYNITRKAVAGIAAAAIAGLACTGMAFAVAGPTGAAQDQAPSSLLTAIMTETTTMTTMPTTEPPILAAKHAHRVWRLRRLRRGRFILSFSSPR